MSDFRKQVRDHYDEQSLPAEKLEAILARGREAAAEQEKTVEFPVKKKSWARYAAAVAAVIVLALAGTWWTQRDVGAVSYAALPPRLIEFFEQPDLHAPIQDKTELREWLLSKGAPADFQIPASLLQLDSAACQVLDVKGRNAYLSCYVREKKADGSPAGLIHLLVARTEDFRDQPKSATPAQRELDGWSFASWTKGDTIYTLATPAPMEKLTPFLSAVDLKEGKARYLSLVEGLVGEMAVIGE